MKSLILLAFTLPSTWFVYEAYSQRPQPELKKHMPEKLAMLGKCPACHLEPQPKSECGHETQGWAWEECVDMEYRYPNER